MGRIRWYGPTLVLLVTVLVVMIAGPRLTQNLAHAHKSAEIRLIQQSLENSSSLAQMSEAFRNVAKVVEPSVVHIRISQQFRNSGRNFRNPLEQFFGPYGRPQEDDRQRQEGGEDLQRYNSLRPLGAGSGWVFDDQGHIVTNNHVVTLRDQETVADEIKVKFHDGSERIARVVGRDPKTDIAVLKVDGPVIKASTAGENVEQGDIVFAFGSPLQFQFSMSQGIVSATGRTSIGILRSQGGYENFIQTDAAINPGNSGGPLTNIYGQVIGMNTAIASRTGQFAGIGLAIPIDDVVHVVQQLIERGEVARGFIGIQINDLDPMMAQTFGFKGHGVLVDLPVPGSPAEKAGIQSGDIITGVNGKNYKTAAELRNNVSKYAPGTKLEVEYFRNGKTHTVDVVIAQVPDQMAMSRGQFRDRPEADPSADDFETLRKLGLERVSTMTEGLAARYRLDFREGVLVESVRRGSSAFASGISRSAVITSVMGKSVRSVQELVDEIKKHDLTKPIRVRVMQGNSGGFRLLQLPKE